MIVRSLAGQSGAEPVAKAIHGAATSPIVLVCEHASHRIPDELDNLGLQGAALTSHIAWDPGAFEVAKQLARDLGAPLIYSTVSRLVYDCNRPPEAEAAMPAKSETYDIPGNSGLSDAVRADRIDRYYRPFERLLSDTLDAHAIRPALVTIHSFTPSYMGQVRAVELGILHDGDARLADALLDRVTGYVVARNDPYGPEDGVTHTLLRHAIPRGLLNVMIEIRNDLLATSEQRAQVARELCGWLTDSHASLSTNGAEAIRG